VNDNSALPRRAYNSYRLRRFLTVRRLSVSYELSTFHIIVFEHVRRHINLNVFS